MQSLTSTQRKLVYLVVMLIMLGAASFLGMPAATAPNQAANANAWAQGGLLARKRAEYDLGETSLGNVEPTSATMNLVLLGMRGIAASWLWHDAIEHQKNKDWAKLRSTTDSIILLQPHYIKVWNFQGWNLAYNVSAEWDKVDDRYYWVKEGIKFLKRGVERNDDHPELYWYHADTLGKKIGRADEAKQFRGYFKGAPGYPDPEPDPDDPEPDIRKRRKRYPSGFDTDLNPDGRDNFLVAKDEFKKANHYEKLKPHLQHIMANVIFRTYPVRAQTEYAQALQREGSFDEITREAWRTAADEWQNDYGQEEIDTEAGRIRLQLSEDEFRQMVQEDEGITNPFKTKSFWVKQYDKMVNYSYWLRRCKLESEENVDYLIPRGVEQGDSFTVTLDGKSIGHKAASGDPAKVVEALVYAWTQQGETDPAFGAVRAEAAKDRDPSGTLVDAVKLTWRTAVVQHEPALSATNGGEKDEQQLERRIATRSVVEAHRELYEGERAHFANDFLAARKLLAGGLLKFQQTLTRYPDFLHDDDLTEEIMVGIHEWQETLNLLEEQPAEDDPLIPVWRLLLDLSLVDVVRNELAAGNTKHKMDFIAAERELMQTRPALVLLRSMHHQKQMQIRMEYDRRLRTFTSDPKTKKP